MKLEQTFIYSEDNYGNEGFIASGFLNHDAIYATTDAVFLYHDFYEHSYDKSRFGAVENELVAIIKAMMLRYFDSNYRYDSLKHDLYNTFCDLIRDTENFKMLKNISMPNFDDTCLLSEYKSILDNNIDKFNGYSIQNFIDETGTDFKICKIKQLKKQYVKCCKIAFKYAVRELKKSKYKNELFCLSYIKPSIADLIEKFIKWNKDYFYNGYEVVLKIDKDVFSIIFDDNENYDFENDVTLKTKLSVKFN